MTGDKDERDNMEAKYYLGTCNAGALSRQNIEKVNREKK